jgi:hypothetical protein
MKRDPDDRASGHASARITNHRLIKIKMRPRNGPLPHGRASARFQNTAGREMSLFEARASQSIRFVLYGHETGPVLRRR